jgi:hypothetical protein
MILVQVGSGAASVQLQAAFQQSLRDERVLAQESGHDTAGGTAWGGPDQVNG